MRQKLVVHLQKYHSHSVSLSLQGKKNSRALLQQTLQSPGSGYTRSDLGEELSNLQREMSLPQLMLLQVQSLLFGVILCVCNFFSSWHK